MKKLKVLMLISVLVSAASSPVLAHSPPKSARVWFIGLEDGAVVHNPVKLKFGIEGFGVTQAGDTSKKRHTAGHHHLLVDVDTPPNLDEPIPSDAHHIHFDKGETETDLILPPGKHTLQLLLGDEEHEPQDPPLMSEKISVIVK